MKTHHLPILSFLATLALSLVSAKAQLVITEVDAAGSGTSQYKADWFELTNYGSSTLNISGWKMDDNSDSFSLAVSLKGISSIAAGQSVVFIEDTGVSSDSALATNFEDAWFGSTSKVPTGFTIGFYGGSGVGLSQTTDEVNIFNSSGTQITGVEFNTSPANGATFDNSVAKLGGLGTLGDPDPTISTASVVGVDGAFASFDSNEIGSPGSAPEPSTWALMGVAGLLFVGWKRRQALGL